MSPSYLVSRALWIYEMLIIAYAVSSWFLANDTARAVNRALGTVCEPFVGLIRRVLPAQAAGGAGIDFAPMVAVFVLVILQNIIR